MSKVLVGDYVSVDYGGDNEYYPVVRVTAVDSDSLTVDWDISNQCDVSNKCVHRHTDWTIYYREIESGIVVVVPVFIAIVGPPIDGS